MQYYTKKFIIFHMLLSQTKTGTKDAAIGDPNYHAILHDPVQAFIKLLDPFIENGGLANFFHEFTHEGQPKADLNYERMANLANCEQKFISEAWQSIVKDAGKSSTLQYEIVYKAVKSFVRRFPNDVNQICDGTGINYKELHLRTGVPLRFILLVFKIKDWSYTLVNIVLKQINLNFDRIIEKFDPHTDHDPIQPDKNLTTVLAEILGLLLPDFLTYILASLIYNRPQTCASAPLDLNAIANHPNTQLTLLINHFAEYLEKRLPKDTAYRYLQYRQNTKEILLRPEACDFPYVKEDLKARITTAYNKIFVTMLAPIFFRIMETRIQELSEHQTYLKQIKSHEYLPVDIEKACGISPKGFDLMVQTEQAEELTQIIMLKLRSVNSEESRKLINEMYLHDVNEGSKGIELKGDLSEDIKKMFGIKPEELDLLVLIMKQDQIFTMMRIIVERFLRFLEPHDFYIYIDLDLQEDVPCVKLKPLQYDQTVTFQTFEEVLKRNTFPDSTYLLLLCNLLKDLTVKYCTKEQKNIVPTSLDTYQSSPSKIANTLDMLFNENPATLEGFRKVSNINPNQLLALIRYLKSNQTEVKSYIKERILCEAALQDRVQFQTKYNRAITLKAPLNPRRKYILEKELRKRQYDALLLHTWKLCIYAQILPEDLYDASLILEISSSCFKRFDCSKITLQEKQEFILYILQLTLVLISQKKEAKAEEEVLAEKHAQELIAEEDAAKAAKLSQTKAKPSKNRKSRQDKPLSIASDATHDTSGTADDIEAAKENEMISHMNYLMDTLEQEGFIDSEWEIVFHKYKPTPFKPVPIKDLIKCMTLKHAKRKQIPLSPSLANIVIIISVILASENSMKKEDDPDGNRRFIPNMQHRCASYPLLMLDKHSAPHYISHLYSKWQELCAFEPTNFSYSPWQKPRLTRQFRELLNSTNGEQYAKFLAESYPLRYNHDNGTFEKTTADTCSQYYWTLSQPIKQYRSQGIMIYTRKCLTSGIQLQFLSGQGFFICIARYKHKLKFNDWHPFVNLLLIETGSGTLIVVVSTRDTIYLHMALEALKECHSIEQVSVMACPGQREVAGFFHRVAQGTVFGHLELPDGYFQMQGNRKGAIEYLTGLTNPKTPESKVCVR